MADRNIPVERGYSLERYFQFRDTDGNLLDLTGSTFIFKAEQGDGSTSIVLRTGVDAGFTVNTSTRLLLALTPVQTRAFQYGLQNRYEIERRIGGAQESMCSGFFIGSLGVNEDA